MSKIRKKNSSIHSPSELQQVLEKNKQIITDNANLRMTVDKYKTQVNSLMKENMELKVQRRQLIQNIQKGFASVEGFFQRHIQLAVIEMFQMFNNVLTSSVQEKSDLEEEVNATPSKSMKETPKLHTKGTENGRKTPRVSLERMQFDLKHKNFVEKAQRVEKEESNDEESIVEEEETEGEESIVEEEETEGEEQEESDKDERNEDSDSSEDDQDDSILEEKEEDIENDTNMDMNTIVEQDDENVSALDYLHKSKSYLSKSNISKMNLSKTNLSMSQLRTDSLSEVRVVLTPLDSNEKIIKRRGKPSRRLPVSSDDETSANDSNISSDLNVKSTILNYNELTPKFPQDTSTPVSVRQDRLSLASPAAIGLENVVRRRKTVSNNITSMPVKEVQNASMESSPEPRVIRRKRKTIKSVINKKNDENDPSVQNRRSSIRRSFNNISNGQLDIDTTPKCTPRRSTNTRISMVETSMNSTSSHKSYSPRPSRSKRSKKIVYTEPSMKKKMRRE